MRACAKRILRCARLRGCQQNSGRMRVTVSDFAPAMLPPSPAVSHLRFLFTPCPLPSGFSPALATTCLPFPFLTSAP